MKMLSVVLFGVINTMGYSTQYQQQQNQKTIPPTDYTDYKCYDIESDNPCTEQNIANKRFHFKSCDSCCNFIQCDASGNSWEMPCGEGTYWDQKAYTCNHNYGQCSEQCGLPHKYTKQKPKKRWTTTPKDCSKICTQQYDPVCCNGVTYSNQCSAEADCLVFADDCVAGACAQKYTRPKYTTQKPQKPIGGDTDEYGCLTSAGYSWCEQKQKCLRAWLEDCTTPKYPPQKPQPPQQTQPPQEPKNPVDSNTCYNTLENNPCTELTEEDIEQDLLYFKSCSSCCNFIQCDSINIPDAYDMPCGEGTYWDEDAYACNHNYGQCDEQCGYKGKQYW